MSKRSDGFKVEESQRQSWLSIAAVWAGGMICVPSLMVGGVLVGGGLSMAEIVLSILIGYGLICAYMIFIGMQACDTGRRLPSWHPAPWARRGHATSSARCSQLPASAGSAFSLQRAAVRLPA